MFVWKSQKFWVVFVQNVALVEIMDPEVEV